MLIPRVIPCLLIENGAMVKTRRFKKRTYLGDPVNVINLFNRFEVDEIALLDIGCSPHNREPDVELIATLAEECWVPLSYGGGLSNLKQIESVILSGVEKVVLNTALAKDLTLAEEAAKEFGGQAIVGSIDARKKPLGGYEAYACGGTRRLKTSPTDRARQLEAAGVGEILLQSIERDGEMGGYDLELIQQVTDVTSLPVIACSGAGTRAQLADPIKCAGASAAAAGSLFVFSGPERGVLINFPERPLLERILAN